MGGYFLKGITLFQRIKYFHSYEPELSKGLDVDVGTKCVMSPWFNKNMHK